MYDRVMSALKTWDWHPHHHSARELLQQFGNGPGMLVVLIEALKNEDWIMRERAAYVLGEIRDRRAMTSLLPLLNDERAVVRFHAVYALEKIGDPRAVEALLTALDDDDADVRYRAASGLGRIGDHRAVAPLIAALNDAKNHVQHSAARALGCLGDPRAIEPLRAMLDDLRAQADASPRLCSALEDALALLQQPERRRRVSDCLPESSAGIGMDGPNWSSDS